ncbi:MAG: 4-alpha-glucanotransferase [Oscillibacter sp.]|nr:4-alpha-glucanotransferase [Oscillibacter sp.]
MKRSCGILLPVFSLPSPYGIGTLGKAAYAFVDLLKRAGQSWWQILPLGPTGFGDSPYQSFSSFAGNPYFIDPKKLYEAGLLSRADVREAEYEGEKTRVDYDFLYRTRVALLSRAFERRSAADAEAADAFEKARPWLADYALFTALKAANGGKAWTEWDEELRRREPSALEQARRDLKEEIARCVFLQWLFFKQWGELRDYAHERGIGIIGDLPIYVSPDSADIWSEPEQFLLDDELRMKEVAGVPPDMFNTDGQLWGNPLYDWGTMERDGFGWWIRRVGGTRELFDVIRVDHFRGFDSYWAIPRGAKSAKEGHWVKGPGVRPLRVLRDWFPDAEWIAEDLGYLTDDVRNMRRESGMPGMKVLEFAFDPSEESEYLPHCYERESVCYTGTHDNPPIRAWWDKLPAACKRRATAYLGLNEREGVCRGILRAGLSSVSKLFVAQLQDYLELGAESRTNVPGTARGNWQWRVTEEQLKSIDTKELAAMAKRYGR